MNNSIVKVKTINQLSWFFQIFWQVLSGSDHTVYSGDYDTAMKFVYHERSEGQEVAAEHWIELESSTNLLANAYPW